MFPSVAVRSPVLRLRIFAFTPGNSLKTEVERNRNESFASGMLKPCRMIDTLPEKYIFLI